MEDGAGGEMETYTTYEEYLDSQVTETDMFFLESEDLARLVLSCWAKGGVTILVGRGEMGGGLWLERSNE